MGANKLLPFLGIVVLVMLVFIGFKSWHQDGEEGGVLLSQVPTAPTPDADSPADTIRTLTAEVADIKSQSKVLKQQNAELLNQRDQIASTVKKEVAQDMRMERKKMNEPIMDKLSSQFDDLKARMEAIGSAQQHYQQESSVVSDIPVGLGLDDQSLNMPAPIIWVEPLGTRTDTSTPSGTAFQSIKKDAGSLLDTDADLNDTTRRYLNSADDKKPDVPVYTVPRNATLIGSTGMTALIGKIPVSGTLADPFPFKVIVGNDNLAANGIDIPGLEGMIFSGTAAGDWSLSCVRGTVHSVTYVFSDGTIRTLSSDDNSLQQYQKEKGGGGGSDSTERDLGWISDRRGIPCVAGTRISNAADYLAGQIGAQAIAAGAAAFAQNQSTQVVSPVLGTTTSVITGDAAKFAGLNAIAGGAEAISQYIADRAAQSFDVVYVDTGIALAIHVDQELPIDYEPQGRKTSYAFSENENTVVDLD